MVWEEEEEEPECSVPKEDQKTSPCQAASKDRLRSSMSLLHL